MKNWPMKDEKYHETVLVKEVLGQLGAHLNKTRVIDATLGTGGHSLAMLTAGAEVLGIEADPGMLAIAGKRLETEIEKDRAVLVQGNFKDIAKVAQENGFGEVDAVLFDLGLTNLQLTSGERGFSFANGGAKLDMRLDPKNQGVTAADLINGLRKDQLEDLFSQIMDFSGSRWLAKRIMEKRLLGPIVTVGDFLEVCRGLRTKPRLDPATLPFLALRVAVNSELENLKEALGKAYALLKPKGKLLVIAFHSKEREIIKNFSEKFIGPVKPSEDEIRDNPRSRSAELFVLSKYDKN